MSLQTLVLAFSVCYLGAYSAELKCDDIQNILKRELKCKNIFCFDSEKWWDYGSPRQYKNRDCDWCELGANDEDCVDRYSGEARCPFAPQFDPLPSGAEQWICPGHCQSMPTIPYQLKVVKTRFFFKDSRTQNYDEPNVRTVDMPTAFKTQHSSCDSGQQPADPNTYAVCPISECKTKRYQDNFNTRVVSCWQWSFNKPRMSHLDTLWKSGDAKIHTLYAGSTGVNKNQQEISMCTPIDDRIPYKFQSEPCWMEAKAPAQQNRQFWIRPHYTYYRSSTSISDVKDCRMLLLGADFASGVRWDQSPLSFLLQSGDSLGEFNINNHWQNPPTRRDHYYNVQSVFDGMQTKFSGFHDKEDKTIARWDFTIPCEHSYNNIKRSSNVIYADSGCTDRACVDFITKPCYDNVYRYDEMVCTLIQDVFKDGGVRFSKFKQKIIRLTDHRQPFMSYGLHDGSSYFDIGYDTAKVQVKRDGTTLDPNVPHIFSDDHTISVSLTRDASRAYSCDACFDVPLHGRFALTDTAMANDIIPCRPCLDYEKVQVTQSSRNYQDCRSCAKHQVRNPGDPAECRKCKEIDVLTPMRRTTPLDTVCTACQFFQYFDENTEQGCRFLPTVTDGIAVVSAKAKLSGKDSYYIQDEKPREIEAKFYRDNIDAKTPWNTERVSQPCSPAIVTPAALVNRLMFTAWCGHQEMVRHQQAWLRLHGGMLYLPLNSDQPRTRISTSAVELCGGSLLQVQGSPTVDLTCAQGQYNFSIIRYGFQDPCTLCVGAKFTDKCWPTYVPELEQYDDEYFLPKNKALTPQPGTCAWCNKVCSEADHFIDPVQYSCWWNGTGRIPGVLGSSATNFSWYKLAPCSKCDSVKLTTDRAELVLACGNRVSYRRWITDTVTGSELDATRSIPSIQICCAEALPSPATLCTDDPANFETFAQLNCKKFVDDTPPAFAPYCPRGWYVDEACSRESALWNPDCCVKCKACRGGLFKLDAYYDCPGDEFFDSQDRGCTTKCLTNQYLRNERCIKCEACE